MKMDKFVTRLCCLLDEFDVSWISGAISGICCPENPTFGMDFKHDNNDIVITVETTENEYRKFMKIMKKVYPDVKIEFDEKIN